MSTNKTQNEIITKDQTIENKSYQKVIEKERKTQSLCDFLENLLNLELSLEEIKQDLSLRKDFNLFMLYETFDSMRLGYILIPDFQEVLYDLGIVPKISDLKLLFKRYDIDRDGKLDFNEFCSIFYPNRNEYKIIMNKNSFKYDYTTRSNQEELFISEDTKDVLITLLKVALSNEVECENLKEKLNNTYNYVALDFFNILSKDSNTIKSTEVELFLKENGVLINKYELAVLIDRFVKQQTNIEDKMNIDGNGIKDNSIVEINFTSFTQEILPRFLVIK